MERQLPLKDLSFVKAVFNELSLTKLGATLSLISLGQAAYLSLAGILGILVNQVLAQDGQSLLLLLVFPVVWLVASVLSGLGRLYSSTITQDVRKISKDLIFRHIIELPNTVYVSRDAGEVESLMQELSFSCRFIFGENFPFFIRSLMTLAISLVIIGGTSWTLAIALLVWSFFFLPMSYWNAKKSVRGVADSIQSASRVSAATVEVIQNHELIPAFGTEEFETARFKELLNNEWVCFNRAQRRIDLCDLLQKVFLALLPLGLVCFLIFFHQMIDVTPGGVASILSLTLILTSQIGDFGKTILSFLEMRVRMRTALIKLACPVELAAAPAVTIDKRPKSWGITFTQVGFGYAKFPAVQDISFDIKENEKVGIIGYSGAGKTTLIKLLRRVVMPQHGEIQIGGELLSQIDPGYLAQNIAEVSQTIPLFHRTIRENVAYGLEYVEDEAIWAILERAQLADYVRRLPEGLDTVVGVRGQKLSGGERARIGIARAFIRDAKIIVLDEATAALDSESELLVQQGLDQLVEGRTVIAIAHRLSTLRKVDRIFVLEKGRLVAEGSHQELIERDGLYRRLWEAQTLL